MIISHIPTDLQMDSKVQKDFMLEMAKLLNTYMTDQCQGKVKVVDFHHPHQLQEMMGDCLTVDAVPRDLHQVLSDCKETLKYCVKTGTICNVFKYILKIKLNFHSLVNVPNKNVMIMLLSMKVCLRMHRPSPFSEPAVDGSGPGGRGGGVADGRRQHQHVSF